MVIRSRDLRKCSLGSLSKALLKSSDNWIPPEGRYRDAWKRRKGRV